MSSDEEKEAKESSAPPSDDSNRRADLQEGDGDGGPPSAAIPDDDGASGDDASGDASGAPCWICLKEGPDVDNGELPVGGNCACQIDSSGHAHISCIVARARQKNESDFQDETILNGEYSSLKSALDGPWVSCHKCLEPFGESVAARLAKEYVKCNTDRCDADFRRLMAVMHFAETEDEVLKNHQRAVQLFGHIVDTSHSSLAAEEEIAETTLLRRFAKDIERDASRGLAFAEYNSPITKKAPKPVDACCWICLDEGPDIDGTPLMRDCACRGEAGFCHISCIKGYAKEKNAVSYRKLQANQSDGRLFWDELTLPWKQCPTCHQAYGGGLAVGVAQAFVHTNRGLPYWEVRHMAALETLTFAHMAVNDFDSAIALFEQQFDGLRSVPPQLAQMAFEHETKLLTCMAAMYSKKGDRKKWEEILTKLRERGTTHLAIGGSSDPACHISIDDLLSKSKPSIDEEIDSARAILERAKVMCGPDSQEAFDFSLSLARSLFKGEKFAEALAVLGNLVTDAKRVLGPDHVKTQEYLKCINFIVTAMDPLKEKEIRPSFLTMAKLVSDNAKLNGKRVQAVRYTKDNKKMIITFTSNDETKKFKVVPTQLVFEGGTMVRIPDGKLGMILSFDEEKKMYTVGEWGALKSTLFKPEDLIVQFKDPGGINWPSISTRARIE